MSSDYTENYAWIINLFDEAEVYKFSKPTEILKHMDADSTERLFYRSALSIKDIVVSNVTEKNGFCLFDLTNGDVTNLENVQFISTSTNDGATNLKMNEQPSYFENNDKW